jgi:hypothetical protein
LPVARIILKNGGQDRRYRGFSAVKRTLALAAAVAIASLTPAGAATIQTYKVANWDLGAYTNNNTGRFTHCAASARYRNGLTLIFSVSESLEWGISFLNPDWNLRQGRELEVEYRIDGGRENRATARAVNERQIVAKLPDSTELFNQFRYGYRLVVSINDGRTVPFDLRDTNAMLTEVLRCANRHKGYADNNTNRSGDSNRDTSPRGDNRTPNSPQSGFASGSSRRDTPPRDNPAPRETPEDQMARLPERNDNTPPQNRPAQTPQNTPAVGPTSESRAEATTLATDILRRANFTYEFLSPEKAPENLRKYDAAWRADNVLGTLRVLPAANQDKVRGELIADDANSCKGKFASGALPGMSGSQSQTIFTSCESDNNWSVYYIAVPRRKGGIYLLGVAGTGEQAARMQAVANSYRTVALEVLER